MQVVEAIVEGLDRIPYLYDTNAVTLEVGQGCAGAPGPFRQIGDLLYVTDIPLAHSLSLGETLTLEYWTSYHYDANPADPEEREYRRAVMSTLENFDMRIEFHPDQVPAAVWWAVWDGMEGRVLEQEQVTPDSQHSVHRYLRSLERSVVGFHWRWERPAPCPSIGSVSDAQKAVIAGGEAARDSAASLAQASGDVINQALREMASRLTERAPEILAANAGDMADGAGRGPGPGTAGPAPARPGPDAGDGPPDRAAGRRAVPAETTPLGDLPGGPSGGGLRLAERRVPVGVIGANFEARPNVTIDIASQLLKSRNAGVLRTGGAALRSAAALADHVIAPAAQAAGLDPRVVQLVRSADREAAVELVRQPGLIPLVILRGSGETTRSLAAEAARAGVRTLAHADGGGVLYLDRAADPAMAAEIVTSSLDRLGVCNRLNLLLIAAPAWDQLLEVVLEPVRALGITPVPAAARAPAGPRVGPGQRARGHPDHRPGGRPGGRGRAGQRLHVRARGRHRHRRSRRGPRVPGRLPGDRRVLERHHPAARRVQAARCAGDGHQRGPRARPARPGHLPRSVPPAVRGRARLTRGPDPPTCGGLRDSSPRPGRRLSCARNTA